MMSREPDVVPAERAVAEIVVVRAVAVASMACRPSATPAGPARTRTAAAPPSA